MIIITTIVLVQFQVSVVCDLHGFSPQGDVFLVGRKLSESDARNKRESESLYNSFLNGNRYYDNQFYSKGGDILTREIRVKQGRLKGLVREFKDKRLKNVEVFLGIPYAAPPVKALRFMPPGSPPTWPDLKIFDSFPPVCPQNLPDIRHEPLKTMNSGYFNRLKKLLPFLTNQSEDCLYLNIYAPAQDYKYKKKNSVVVYIHGESFEWNSGNPYDGSVLASYGKVIVVTINFRLGILGFLKPGISEHTVSNFGLLDQIAALQWIKDNIEEFGGDSSSVTLMGQGTGAACINFLMVSPVSMASEGLFHKAILMSGTALSDWAVTHNPLQFTIQVAEALNCPLIEKDDELPNCLRRKRLSEIMSVKVSHPEFQTPFGPIVDGSVIPNTPQQVMGVYQNLFTRYELLYGLTEWESYHTLDPVSLTYGMLEEERNELLRKYMHSRYEALPYFALATTLSEYLDWKKPFPSVKSAAEEHRDLVLDLLSDARFAAPIIQMALYHSKINPKSYLYVFQHKSNLGEFAGGEHSVSGEEIAYVFGSPLLNEDGSLAYHKFSLSEQLLSEFILTYFTNFIKTGNPNAPRRSEYYSLGPKDWQLFDVYWPEYDAKNQSYLSLDIPPYVSHHYRSEMTQYWNKILPDLLSNPTKMKQQKPEARLKQLMQRLPNRKPASESAYSIYKKLNEEKGDEWTYGTVRMSPNEYDKEWKYYRQEEKETSKQMDHPLGDTETISQNEDSRSSWIAYLIGVSVCLLLINATVIALYYYKRKKFTSRASNSSISDGGFEDRFNSINNINLHSIEQPETLDVKPPQKTNENLRRVLTNTSESSAKLKKWFQEGLLKKYNKGKKGDSETEVTELNILTTTANIKPQDKSIKEAPIAVKPILKTPKKPSLILEECKTIPRKNVQKVSVGIDATPSARGSSVLKQTPIEITKSLDRTLLITESDSFGEPSNKEAKSVRKLQTSISLQLLPTEKDVKFTTPTEPEVIKLGMKSDVSLNNFKTFFAENSKDIINVTSRDSEESSIPDDKHVDPLENIQKRNLPKVLPDFPNSNSAKRLSHPQFSFRNAEKSNQNKLHGPAPLPPPRLSTLQRKDKKPGNGENESKFITFSSFSLKAPVKKKTNEPVEMIREKSHQGTDEKSGLSSGSSGSSGSNELAQKPDSLKNTNSQFESKSNSGTENKSMDAKRDKPSIVIQPKIGPKKSAARQQKAVENKARINLQMRDSEKVQEKKSNHVPLDSKGPSDQINDVKK